MSAFSDLLLKLIEEKNISKNSICGFLGIDRTILYRYIQGKSIPTRERLDQICIAMSLSPSSKVELIEAFEITENGAELYEQRKIVRQIITDLPNVLHQEFTQPNFKTASKYETIGDSEILYGRANINSKIKFLFDYQISEEKYAPLRILIQPDYTHLFDLLIATPTKYRKKLNIIHCVRFQEFDSCLSNKKKHHTLDYMKQIIPLLFSSQSDDSLFYQPHYFYDNNVTKNMRLMELMPNLIVNNNYVLLISHDYEKALFFSNKDIIRFYTNEFNRLLENSTPLLQQFHNEYDISAFLYKLETENNAVTGELKSDPCILSCVPEELIDKKVMASMPNRDLVVQITKDRIRLANENFKNGMEYNEFFDERGIENIIETGFISDIPNEYVKPLEKHEIALLFKNLIEKLTSYENFNSLLLNSGKLEIFKNGVYIFIHKDYGVMFGCNSNSMLQTTLFVITEKTITNAFNDFFVNFKNDRIYVKTKQETIDYLHKKIMELET